MSPEKLFEVAEKPLRSAGVRAGQRCLDFGCGHGNYTIPLGRLVGPEGTVYAVDKNKDSLDELAERARAEGLANIRLICSSKPHLPSEVSCVDLVLLYDVLHSHYFTARQRSRLFRQVAGVACEGAVLSVFPHHMDSEEIEREVRGNAVELGFHAAGQYEGPVVHDDAITQGCVINFRKSESSQDG